MADLSKVTLPSGTTYDLKDAQAREDIESIQNSLTSSMRFLGTTTTALSEGDTAGTITIDSESVTVGAGDVVLYGEFEFIYGGADNKWHKFGPNGSFKALAFKDNASGNFTPAGDVSQPTFTGTAATISMDVTAEGSVSISTGSGTANYTPAGTVSKPNFTGTEGNVSVTGTPTGNVTISEGTGIANYTPEGSVSKPNFTGAEGDVSVTGTAAGTVTISKGTGTANYTPEGSISVTPDVQLNTTTVNSITEVGTLPTCTLPEMTATVSGETLTLGWTAGSFSQGTLPTKGSNVTVATGIKSQSASGTFTGTGAELKATFNGESVTSTGKFTPEGNVSQPTFTGTGAELKATFTGTSTTSTGKFTPTGDVSQPTFSGTGVDLEATFTGDEVTASANYTPAGTVSKPTFTGTQGTVTVS